tara:strand:+ start:1326 stop:3209 length:1884 start_codon:yes stop_codon:yes gene_type:complete
MPLNQLNIKPGVVKDLTDYSTGKLGPFWTDSDKVRFRNGYATKIGGWEKQSLNGLDASGNVDRSSEGVIHGVPRAIRYWQSITDNQNYMAVGTSDHLYIILDDVVYDITPVRATSTNLSNPLAVTDGSTTVTVTDSTHGASVGDWIVITDAATTGGIAADTLNRYSGFQITTVVDANTFKIEVPSAATSTVSSGGGTSLDVTYLVSEGLGTTGGAGSTGWGAGTWGLSTWGTARSVTVDVELSQWSLNLWGEDLIATVRNEDIYFWDLSVGPTTRASLVSGISGAGDVPTKNRITIISFPDRHLISAGTVPYEGSVIDPMQVRWSDQEDYDMWTPTATNTAGSQRLQIGTKIVTVASTREETFISTDEAVYGMQFIGPPFTFSFRLVGTNCGAIGYNAMENVESSLYWMGKNDFYFYNGNISEMPCPVKHYVFGRIRRNQVDKIFSAHNAQFNEICWFYPSTDNPDPDPEPDSYVCYNYVDQVWTVGTLARTCWHDSFGSKKVPFAFDKSGNLYDHETGSDDDGSAMTAFIESSPLEISQTGEELFLVDKIVPDLISVGDVKLTIKTRKYPQSSDITKGPFTISPDSTKISIRARGRQMSFKVESDATGDSWLLGDFRINSRQDGIR